MREDNFIPGFGFVPTRGKTIDYNNTVNIPPTGFRDPSKFGLLELKKESLDKLVSRLEIEAKEAIERRIDSVYLKHVLLPYQKANLKLNTEGIKFDVEKWKKLMAEQPLQIVSSYVDVTTIESDGYRYRQSLTRDVWDFIKVSADVECKNGQYYYKINDKIYTNK